DDQGVLALADRSPGLDLSLRGGGERGGEPVPGDRAEALEGVPLALRWFGLSWRRVTGHRYMVHAHTDRNERPGPGADSCPLPAGLPRRAGWASAHPQRKLHGAERTEPTSGLEVLWTVQTTVRSPADQAPAPG